MDDSSDSLLMISVNNEDLELLTSDYEISITDEYNYSTIILKQDSEIISSHIIPITENRIKITLCDFGKYISLSQFNNGQFEQLGQFKFNDKKLSNQTINPRLVFEGNYNIKNITRNF